ncbi:MAG: prolipoprotein diacylglyceryl transferase, partial [Methylococcales bacterium]|nr:prolipoprotein diacylglyceryl transferase [Methylococcales bacterium]
TTLYDLIEAVQAGNSAVAEALAPHLLARYPSQIHAAMFEGAYVFVMLALIWRKPQRPGVIGAGFLMVYAAARIWTEQYRQPDLHIGFELFYLTRGQWLSIATLLAGIALFIYCKKTGPDLKVGGWTSPAKKK